MKPGNARWEYIGYWAKEVRRLVVHATVVEGVWDGMKVGPKWDAGVGRKDERWFGRKEQLEVWNGLDEGMKRDLKLAHKGFDAGVKEGGRR